MQYLSSIWVNICQVKILTIEINGSVLRWSDNKVFSCSFGSTIGTDVWVIAGGLWHKLDRDWSGMLSLIYMLTVVIVECVYSLFMLVWFDSE